MRDTRRLTLLLLLGTAVIIILLNIYSYPFTGILPPTPMPTPTPIAVLSSLVLNAQVQPDGTLKSTSSLTLNAIGIGELSLSHPEEMNLHDSGTVRLSIMPDGTIISLTSIGTSLDSLPTPPSIEFTDRIDIYPVMHADLLGEGFAISPEKQSLKAITSDRPTEWIWSIQPKRSGLQALAVLITIPVKVDGVDEDLSYSLKSIPAYVDVKKTFSDWVSELLPIVAPTLLVLSGSAFGYYYANKGRDRKVDQLKGKVENLDKAIEEAKASEEKIKASDPMQKITRLQNTIATSPIESAALDDEILQLTTDLTDDEILQLTTNLTEEIKKIRGVIAKSDAERIDINREIARLTSIPKWQFWRK